MVRSDRRATSASATNSKDRWRFRAALLLVAILGRRERGVCSVLVLFCFVDFRQRGDPGATGACRIFIDLL